MLFDIFGLAELRKAVFTQNYLTVDRKYVAIKKWKNILYNF